VATILVARGKKTSRPVEHRQTEMVREFDPPRNAGGGEGS
jgi:hypothetical protein